MSWRRRIVPVVSVAVALGAVAVGVAVTLQRRAAQPRSEVITAVGPAGPQQQVLLPRLEKRVVVVVDRPHNPGDNFRPGEPPPEHVKRRRSFFVSTNSIGLRGPEVKLPAPRFRVICAGDSITFGWGVTLEQTWCVQLARMLNIDPVLAAWPAARPEDLLAWIKKNARALDADLVLFTWGPGADDHNLARYLPKLRQTMDTIAPIKMGWVLPPAGTFDPLAVKNARELYPKLQRRAPYIPLLDLTPAFRAATPRAGVVGEFKGGRQRMRRLSDGKVLVDVKAPPPHPEFGVLLAPAIIAAFEADPKIKEPLFFDGGHPDAEGFTVFARAVASWIRARGWIR